MIDSVKSRTQVEEKKQGDTLIVQVKEDVVSDFEKYCFYAVFVTISWLQNREEIIAEWSCLATAVSTIFEAYARLLPGL